MNAQGTERTEKRLCVGLLAHVDAGKTTLSEAMLYRAGVIRTFGRVDHGDTFLDTDAQERSRGITIFSKQAVLPLPGCTLTLLDTPGHVDFSAEMERTLQVLDCAVLIISGTAGIQGHTVTLWRLLRRYQVPVILFFNKMDMETADRDALLAAVRVELDEGCIDFSQPQAQLFEELSLSDEALMESYLTSSTLSDAQIASLVSHRRVFPCLFGSALRQTGVDALLDALRRFVDEPARGAEFGAHVFKIARDEKGARLTFLKVTGGTLLVKQTLRGEGWEEKADQLRLYSGSKFTLLQQAPAGTVCAVTGLSKTMPGDVLGRETAAQAPVLQPVLEYRLLLDDGTDAALAYGQLRMLEEEDPALHLVWNALLREIRVQLMGPVQMEILQKLIESRFGLRVSFDAGNIVYLETIAAPVEGVGHYEPLRHYAEVHLLLEPGEPGSGITLASVCPTDKLDLNWQRLIFTHLLEKPHLGVLTGSPITDIKITLLAGRAHEKHTEGGDFRQATYRAVRHGLMQAESVLLEPWYRFRLEVPAQQVGRAMTDLQQMGGKVDPPETVGEETALTGTAPVAGLRDYAREVAVYTRGQGRLSCVPAGYFPCAEAEAVIEAMGYDPERDVENTADSVFCSHGAGVVIPWREVAQHAQVDSGWRPQGTEPEPKEAAPQRRPVSTYAGTAAQDKELQAIFERTYGAVKRESFLPPKAPKRPVADHSEEKRRELKQAFSGEDYLLVDGYNIIFAWDELKKAAAENLDAARKKLCDLLCNYQGYRKCRVILVFDAYKVKGGLGSVEKYHNITIVYTKEAETADAYIERATYEIGRQHRVRVATSDGPEQIIILGHGALRLSASAFHEEMMEVQKQIGDTVWQNNRKNANSGAVRAALKKAKEGGGC